MLVQEHLLPVLVVLLSDGTQSNVAKDTHAWANHEVNVFTFILVIAVSTVSARYTAER